MKSEVSAFMDDALEEGSQSAVLDALCRDGSLRHTWSDYHLIGDVLRRSPRLAPDLTGRVMAQLAAEPTVLAPAHAAARRHGVLRYALPLAASVMGAGAVAWIAQSLNAPPALSVAAISRLAPAQQAQPAQPAPPQLAPQLAAAPAGGEAELAKPSQVKPYLFAHQGYSPVSSIQGVAHYVRTLSDTREGAAR